MIRCPTCNALLRSWPCPKCEPELTDDEYDPRVERKQEPIDEQE